MKKTLAFILAIIVIVTTFPMVYAEDNTYKVGDIIQFGSYPQSEVKDEVLISELNALAPKWEDWTSYDYYSGDGNYGSMVSGDWMRYTDVTFEGEKYRAVKFTHIRPRDTYNNFGTTQNYNGYDINTIYWFKFEPINWIILNNDGWVASEILLDAQPYSNTIYYDENATIKNEKKDYSYFSDPQYANYASNYETCSIRKWLNSDFYNTAFTDEAKDEIKVTAVKDAGLSEVIVSNTTYDKIFLLSYSETMVIGEYENFDKDQWHAPLNSDYAKSQGGTSGWNMRGSGYQSEKCWFDIGVDASGELGIGWYMFMNNVYSVVGTRAALTFVDASKLHEHDYKLTYHKEPELCTEGKNVYACYCGATYSEVVAAKHNYTSSVTKDATHINEGIRTYFCECGDSYTETIEKLTEHTYKKDVTAPSCTAQGYTTYTCICGDTYIGDYIFATGHKDTDGDFKCDYDCGYEFDKPVSEKPEEEKNIIEKIIEWFKNILNILFGWMKK